MHPCLSATAHRERTRGVGSARHASKAGSCCSSAFSFSFSLSLSSSAPAPRREGGGLLGSDMLGPDEGGRALSEDVMVVLGRWAHACWRRRKHHAIGLFRDDLIHSLCELEARIRSNQSSQHPTRSTLVEERARPSPTFSVWRESRRSLRRSNAELKNETLPLDDNPTSLRAPGPPGRLVGLGGLDRGEQTASHTPLCPARAS